MPAWRLVCARDLLDTRSPPPALPGAGGVLPAPLLQTDAHLSTELSLTTRDLGDFEELMRLRIASINDLPIGESDCKYHWPIGRRPNDHPGLSELGL